jgi:hypothetical protein
MYICAYTSYTFNIIVIVYNMLLYNIDVYIIRAYIIYHALVMSYHWPPSRSMFHQGEQCTKSAPSTHHRWSSWKAQRCWVVNRWFLQFMVIHPVWGEFQQSQWVYKSLWVDEDPPKTGYPIQLCHRVRCISVDKEFVSIISPSFKGSLI